MFNKCGALHSGPVTAIIKFQTSVFEFASWENYRCFCSKMAVILETLSLRSLLAFAFLLLCILITFFVTGGKIGRGEVNISCENMWLHEAIFCMPSAPLLLLHSTRMF